MPTTQSGSPHRRFGDLLRAHRVDKGLTQELLAEHTGLSVRGISDIERGLRNAPRRETIVLLSRALDLSREETAVLVAAARRAPRPRAQRSVLLRQAASGTLPAITDSLVGRGSEIAAITLALHDPQCRLLTLTGPPGVGKTRLAVEVAHRLAALVPDEIVFVDLAPLRNSALVLPAIAVALGVQETGTLGLVDRLQARLTARPAVLILDNFEHLQAAAPLVSDLLDATADLRVLVTSREPLRLRGEREMPVPPLATPELTDGMRARDVLSHEAVDLFVMRANASHAQFHLTDQNARAIAGLCVRLDGLPLAIELAAARVKMFSPAAIVERLDQRRPVLIAGTRDAPERQRTLTDAIAWSYELLREDEERLFRRLSAFLGGWTLEAAEAVANPDGELDVFAGIASLQDKNLITRQLGRSANVRFTTFETIREFGLQRLEASGETEATRQRHAAYFLALGDVLGRDLTNAAAKAALERLRTELPNLRAAFAWSLDHGEAESVLRVLTTFALMWSHATPSEGMRWLEAGLAQGEAVTPHTRIDALQLASDLSSLQADYDRADTLATEALALAEAHDYPFGKALAWVRLGQSAEWRGDLEKAAWCHEQALTLIRPLNDPFWTALSYSNVGDALLWVGEPARAAPFADEGLERWRVLRNEWGVALALGTVAAVALALDDHDRAIRFNVESLTLWQAMGDRRGVGGALAGFAAVALARDEPERAARLLGAAQALGDAAGISHLAHHVQYERALADTRFRLSEAAFHQAWQEGTQLQMEAAIAEAMQTSAVS